MTDQPKPSDPWRELSRTISNLLTHYPFYGHILTSLARKMDKQMQYAAGIGIGTQSVLVINPDLFFREDRQKQMGLLIHEIEHVLRLHVPRFRNTIRNNRFLKKKANIAMDLAINCTISEHLLPFWVLHPRQFNLESQQTAEWYYAHLPEVQIASVTFGTFGEKKKSSASSDPGKLIRNDFDTPETENSKGGKIPPELEHQIVKEMMQSARDQTERSKGHLPSHVQNMLDQFNQEAKISWHLLFRRVCQWASLREKAYTKKRRSRRYGTRPGPYMKRHLKLTVAFDTSGSISDDDLAWFFSELDHIQKTGAQITLIQCDAEIQKVETYARSFNREKHSVYGRGGTAFTPVFDYINEERTRTPDLLVFFTDGYGDNPKNPERYPVCWIYTPYHQKAADFGFHIEYEPGKKEAV